MYQNIFVQDKWTILVPKMVLILITLNQLYDFLKKFCRMKGANRYIKILLVVFREKDSFGTIWSFLPLGHFLLFDWTWSNWATPLLIGSLNSQDIISFMITTGSLNSQDMIRIQREKQWRHDFSGKDLCDRYCMDLMWCSCWVRNSWFCKAFLRICYVSLFECKGPWMPKSVINCHVRNRELQN